MKHELDKLVADNDWDPGTAAWAMVDQAFDYLVTLYGAHNAMIMMSQVMTQMLQVAQVREFKLLQRRLN